MKKLLRFIKKRYYAKERHDALFVAVRQARLRKLSISFLVPEPFVRPAIMIPYFDPYDDYFFGYSTIVPLYHIVDKHGIVCLGGEYVDLRQYTYEQ